MKEVRKYAQLFVYTKSIHSAYTAQLPSHTHPPRAPHTHSAPLLARDEEDLRASVSQEALVD